MIFGKYINRYYLKYAWILLVGLAALVLVDYFQLEVPELYRMVVNGINTGVVETAEGTVPFDLNFLLDKICLPLIFIILVMVVGRFTWRICFFGTGIRVETSIRDRMFDHCKDLSAQYYQVNKVGNLMSLFTNDLETIQECFGSGIMMMCDAAFLGILTIVKMWRMDVGLTLQSSAALLLASGILVREIHDEEVGDPPGRLFRPFRFLAGELFGHRRHQGVRQGDERAPCLPPPQQAHEEGQRLLHQGLDAPQYHGDALRRVRHLYHLGLRRLSRLSGAVQRGAARRIHRLLHGDGLAP